MNITILTYGSRGDVQPFLPLSLSLMKRGHRVKLVAPAHFKTLVEGRGIPFVPLAGDPEDLSRRMNNSGFNFIKMIQEIMHHATEIALDIMRQTEESCRDADLIIHTFLHAVGAHTFARENNIPDVHVQLFPMFTPTSDYPNVAISNLGIRALNRMTHVLSAKVTWMTARWGFEQVRRQAGLPKRKLYFPFEEDPLRPPTPLLCAWSPIILPPSSDWKSNVHVTGYFFFESDDSYQPPDELQSFLNSGKKPICVSFGSMVNRDAEKIDQIVREALKQTGQRGVILSGWGKVHQPSSKDLLYFESVPHDWLLPHCKMIIHHGGAGTMSAGLRAGIPQVVVPFTADQPFWGRRVHRVGAGPRPILVKNLTAKMLRGAIAEAGSKAVGEQANAIGRRIRTESGLNQAVELIESHTRDWNERAIL